MNPFRFWLLAVTMRPDKFAQYTYGEFIRRVWLNERRMPHAP